MVLACNLTSRGEARGQKRKTLETEIIYKYGAADMVTYRLKVIDVMFPLVPVGSSPIFWTRM